MRRTTIVGLFLLVDALAYADEGVQTLDSPPLGVVTFVRGSSRIDPESMQDVQAAAEWQAKHPGVLIVLEGRPPGAGSSSRNLRISEQRTDAVRTALIEAGADPTRMASVAHATRGTAERGVTIRATDAFPELVAEQRDPNIGEDARAKRQAAAKQQARAPAPASQGNTVVVVPNQVLRAPAPPPMATPAPEDIDSTAGSTTGTPAGGMQPTTGGTGASAQAGIGMDPTDGTPEFTTGFGPHESGANNNAPGVVPQPPGAPGAVPAGAPGAWVPGAPAPIE